MSHRSAYGNFLSIFPSHSSSRHGRTIVISEIERQSLGKVVWVLDRILALMVNMDVGFTCIARVPTLSNDLSLFHILSRFHKNTSGLEMLNEQICPGCQFERNEIASRCLCII
jgi:hypothetical protein